MMSHRIFIVSVLIITALLLSAGCTQQPEGTKTVSGTPGITTVSRDSIVTPAPVVSGDKVLLETSMGNVTIALDPAMPVTAGNFKALVNKGYYNGVIFHRVMDDFMIQGGDPTGTGRGGPGYTIEDEFTATNRNNRGTVSMANVGPNTGGSQFFINLVNNNYLDKKHPVFGSVVEGMDVVDRIAKVETTGEAGNYRPLQNVTIIRAVMV